MSTARYDTLHVTVAAGVATVVIDVPPVNVISVGLMRDLRDLLLGLRNEEVAVIVFASANPDYFLAHVDMRLGENTEALNALDADAPAGLNVFQAVGELVRHQPQVTIVKLAGIARGGGAEFVAAADLAFGAIGRARIGQIESLMGIVPSGGGTQYVVSRVGRNRALELILTGDAIDAQTAERYGWINRAVPADDLDAFVDDTARHIAQLPPGVVAAAKRILSPPDLSAGFRQEEVEWSALIARPAASYLIPEGLAHGAQTVDGERDLEGVLRAMWADRQAGDASNR